MNLQYIFEQKDPVLDAVFILLCIMSLMSWYIILLKAWSLRNERAMLTAFRSQYAIAPDWPRQQNIDTPPPGSVGQLVGEAARLEPVLASYSGPERHEILSLHLVQELDRVRVRLDKGLTVLASVGSASPFIGLFGTVWGVYGALMKLSTSGSAGLSVVAGPMGEALVATAAGLFAAIPAVLAFNGYARLNRVLVQDLRHVAEQLAVYSPVTTPAPQHTAETVRLARESR